MKYLKVVKESCWDDTILNELLTPKEKKRKFPWLSDEYFEIVEVEETHFKYGHHRFKKKKEKEKYHYPTEEGIKEAIEEGWTEEQARRGFDIFDYNGTGLLHIEKIDDCFFGADFENSDYLAAKEAKRIGFCKIIPVKELPKEFDMRYFGWIDTPENRKAIENYCNR